MKYSLFYKYIKMNPLLLQRWTFASPLLLPFFTFICSSVVENYLSFFFLPPSFSFFLSSPTPFFFDLLLIEYIAVRLISYESNFLLTWSLYNYSKLFLPPSLINLVALLFSLSIAYHSFWNIPSFVLLLLAERI